MRIQIFFIFLLSCFYSSFAQNIDEELVQISNKGKRLFEYDSACWVATDSLLKLNPSPPFSHFIAQNNSEGWQIGFGLLDTINNCYKLAYEVFLDNDLVFLSLRESKGELADTGYYYKAAMAIEKVIQNFQGEYSPYNYALSELNGHKISVYLYPGQTTYEYYRLGGDFRFEYDCMTEQITDTIKLHNSVLQLPYVPNKGGEEPVATYHNAVASVLPVETDIFYVLSRKFEGQHYVLTNDWAFIISPGGNITKMKKEIFMNLGK